MWFKYEYDKDNIFKVRDTQEDPELTINRGTKRKEYMYLGSIVSEGGTWKKGVRGRAPIIVVWQIENKYKNDFLHDYRVLENVEGR